MSTLLSKKLNYLQLLLSGQILTSSSGKYSKKQFQKIFAYVDEHYMQSFGCMKDDKPTGETKFAFYEVKNEGDLTESAKTFAFGKEGINFTKSQVKDMFATRPELFKNDTVYLFPYIGGEYKGIKQFMMLVYPQYQSKFQRLLRTIGLKLHITKQTASWAFDFRFGPTGSRHRDRKEVLVLPDTGVCLN